MNRTIKLLTIADIFILTGFGLISPILAIFIKENIIGGTILTASLASTIFLIVKCVIQLPFSKYVDKHDHKIKFLLIGIFLISFVPIIYLFAQDIKMIYLAQIIHGIGAGLAYPTWLGLWSTHLDKKHESFEWSLYSTVVSIGTAISALIGGVIAQTLGFKYAFFFVWLMTIIGGSILFGLGKKEKVLPKVKLTHYHRKRKILGHN